MSNALCRSWIRRGAAALAAAVCVAGCGGGASDNGVAAKSADGIVAAARNAIDGAKSVHASGSVLNSGRKVTLDLTMVAGKGGSGRINLSGVLFQIVALNQKVYVRGSHSFWIQSGAPAQVARLLGGKWVRAPISGQFAPLANFVQTRALFDRLLANHGPLSKGGISTVGGQTVVSVHDRQRGGALYVATTGKPYPIQLLNSGSSAGRIVFDRYNQSASVSAPAHWVDVSSLP